MKSLTITPKKFGVNEEILLLHEGDLAEAIKSLGWEIKGKQIIDKQGNPIDCSICNENINVENIGAFFPGSIEPICSKFACFIGEMAKIRARLRDSS